MFKWNIQVEAIAKANSQDVWDIWVDVASWPNWDHDLEWSTLNGPFIVGSEGKLKPKGVPSCKFSLIAVHEGKSHTTRTRMPMTEIIFHHFLTPCGPSEVRITHRVEVSGLFAPLLWMTMRRSLNKGLPHALKRLAQLAEARSKASK